MSTDAGNAAAPEDAATREIAGDRPGLGSADPESADSQTSTTETAERGTGGSTPSETDADTGDTSGERGPADADDEGFVSGLLRDSTVTGLPGDTGAPPAEPHAPQAQQEGDEPVGSEPPAGDNPRGVD